MGIGIGSFKRRYGSIGGQGLYKPSIKHIHLLLFSVYVVLSMFFLWTGHVCFTTTSLIDTASDIDSQ